MVHSIIGRIGKGLLPNIIKVVIIPIVPIGTIPLRWSIIVSNWLKILIEWFTWLFKSRVDYIFRKNRFNLAKGLKATQVHNSDTPSPFSQRLGGGVGSKS